MPRFVRQAIDDSEQALAGVVITHPHPDHYAGLWHLIGDADMPVVATRAVDEIIRRDDVIKNDTVGPMMGAEWPTHRLFPNHTVDSGAAVTLGGVTLQVDDLGPGESHVDSFWRLDAQTIFAGDIAYNGMHAYLADGHWESWPALLSRLDRELPADVTLHIGHGPAGGKELLAGQRRYVEEFVTAIGEHSAAIEAGDHAPVVAAMRSSSRAMRSSSSWSSASNRCTRHSSSNDATVRARTDPPPVPQSVARRPTASSPVNSGHEVQPTRARAFRTREPSSTRP